MPVRSAIAAVALVAAGLALSGCRYDHPGYASDRHHHGHHGHHGDRDRDRN